MSGLVAWVPGCGRATLPRSVATAAAPCDARPSVGLNAAFTTDPSGAAIELTEGYNTY